MCTLISSNLNQTIVFRFWLIVCWVMLIIWGKTSIANHAFHLSCPKSHLIILVLFCIDTKKNQKKSRLFSFLNAKMKKAYLNFLFDNYMMKRYIPKLAIFEPFTMLHLSWLNIGHPIFKNIMLSSPWEWNQGKTMPYN